MSLDDPNYSALYYHAIKKDHDIALVIRPPRAIGENTTQIPPAIPRNPVFPPRNQNGACFGCGEKGHNMNGCPKFIELVEEGTIRWDQNGKLGQIPAQTYYIACPVTLNGEELDLEDGELLVMPVDQAQKGIKQCKVVFDGVVPPPRPDWAKGRPRPSPTSKTWTSTTPTNKTQMRDLIPVEVCKPQFDSDDDDAIMEDVP
ncbi:hypothetical protein JAAARDRAFT_46740 [Jaapia argillacea MUCL 33604]|uniref:CCHC-type domain-containing protein n=1 Tax=Jaapia argillacea MUCL 33604 TaxID=933084 RepID=A0A067Q9F0_9AGAM|nr:hypothetical protein JAAARDRAFT_46740 [Jaapia argillacea MUCL 33604]